MAEFPKTHFFNRELSFLEFNARVLAEGMNPANPLFERLKFLGIVSSNLDEFFMVRVASLELSGENTEELRKNAAEQVRLQNEYFLSTVVPEMENQGIVRVRAQGLDEPQKDFVRKLFLKELFPVLTPIALSHEKRPPAFQGHSVYLVSAVVDPANRLLRRYAVVEIPKNFPRMIALPSQKRYAFMLIEDLIAFYSNELFAGYEIVDQGFMRLTRAAEMTLDEETDEDFAKIMAEALRERRQGGIVRLELSGSRDMQEYLSKRLEVPENKIMVLNSWLDLRGISQLAFLPMFDDLRNPAWIPRPVAEFEQADDLWELLKKKEVLVMHPYESFEAVNAFVAAAADDPDVLAIKQTLYRAGQDSSIITSLERAAEKGKRVTVLVELKARFDEEKNIQWAKRLEIAGASVIYGVAGLKTHAKACLVVRREPEGIKRYAHLSTGNYNEKTALIYSDIGLFTSREDIVSDLTAFFNMITGFSQPMQFSTLIVAPHTMRRKLKQLIQREVLRSTREKPGLIMAKMNSLVDSDIIEALYQASRAGVKIKLNIRGICCLKPGIKDLSENIEVVSIVDMFLEHSRIFYFNNSGDGEIYLASADWMPRNLDRRIEIMFPVDNPDLRENLLEILNAYLKDNVNSWKLLPDGSYQRLEPADKKFRVQEYLCKKIAEHEAQVAKSIPRELKPQRPRQAKEPLA